MGTDSTGTAARITPLTPANAPESGYLDWDQDGAPVSIHMSLDAMDGIARDVIEGFGTLPRRGLEVGGLLLGRVIGGPRPTVWVERYQRISCEHRFGPQFTLDTEDTAALEDVAARILENGKTAVVGIYRSHARPGFQLEESDFDLIQRYFSDPSDLILLIRAERAGELVGQFYAWDPRDGVNTAGGEFPFHGSVVTPETSPAVTGLADQIVEPGQFRSEEPRNGERLPREAQPAGSGEVGNNEPDTEITSRKSGVPGIPVARETPRRLIPDFEPAPIEPAPSLFGLAGHPGQPRWIPPEDLTEEEPDFGERLKKWWPLAAAILLIGGVTLALIQPSFLQSVRIFKPAPAGSVATARPIGLYVDTSTPLWRLTWNPNATALHDARSVQLFVREGDDQKRIDLPGRDLALGSYQYVPLGNDVTFRLEVVDQVGQVSAESFRVIETASVPPALPSHASAIPPLPSTPQSPAPSASVTPRIVPPKATYRAPPVVAAGIRPRIIGTIGIDVRVQIDARGRVTSARTVTKQTTGLNQYLGGRAVAAARLWRFDPARQNGKPVPSTQTIHFAFEK